MEPPRLLFFLTAVCLCMTAEPAAALAQDFTLKTGQKLKGEIIDASADTVTLQIGEKETTTFEVSRFADLDQSKITAWAQQNRNLYEWPSDRGYRHDGSTDEAISEKEPKILWRAKVGAGDGPVVANTDWAVATGIVGGQFTVTALKAEYGSLKWQNSNPVSPDSGRSLAAASIDKLGSTTTTIAPDGRLDTWKLDSGDNIWATPIPGVYQAFERPVKGRYSSPLLVGDNLLVEVGGPSCSLVQLSRSHGLEAWRIGRHRSVGAPLVLAEVAKHQVIVSRNHYGIVGRRPRSGVMAWDHAWPAKEGYAAPLVITEDRIFVTSAEECAMFQVEDNRTAKLWSNANLCSLYATPVFKDGYLYGFHGDELRCIDATSGEVKWSEKGIKGGNLIRAANQLVIQTGKSGEVVFAAASPAGFTEQNRIKVFTGSSKTHPVLGAGRLICRSSTGDVTCLKVGTTPIPFKPKKNSATPRIKVE